MAVVLRQPPCWYSLGVHSASNCWSAPRLVYGVSVTTLDGPDHLPSLAGEVGAAGGPHHAALDGEDLGAQEGSRQSLRSMLLAVPPLPVAWFFFSCLVGISMLSFHFETVVAPL